MSFSGRLSSADSQTSAFSRRNMLGKLFATAVATAVAKRSAESSAPKSFPSPEFNIGDSVAWNWKGEVGEEFTEFGEVFGLRYLPEPESPSRPEGWVYYVNWTHSNCSDDFCFPYYDGEPILATELRLAS